MLVVGEGDHHSGSDDGLAGNTAVARFMSHAVNVDLSDDQITSAYAGEQGCLWAAVADASSAAAVPAASGTPSTPTTITTASSSSSIASAATTVLGCIGVRMWPRSKKPGADVVAEIKHLCVAPEARRRGLGTRLVDAAVTWAAEHGCTAIRLDTLAPMAAARALYGKQGFVELSSRVMGRGAEGSFTMTSCERRLRGRPMAADADDADDADDRAAQNETERRETEAAFEGNMEGTAEGTTAETLDGHDSGEELPGRGWRDPSWETGSLVQLVSVGTGLEMTVLVERDKGPPALSVRLALPSSPYARLHVAQRGANVSWSGGSKGIKFATFYVRRSVLPTTGEKEEGEEKGGGSSGGSSGERSGESSGGSRGVCGGGGGAAAAGSGGGSSGGGERKGDCQVPYQLWCSAMPKKASRTGSEGWCLGRLQQSALQSGAGGVEGAGHGGHRGPGGVLEVAMLAGNAGSEEAGSAFYAREVQRRAVLVAPVLVPASSSSFSPSSSAEGAATTSTREQRRGDRGKEDTNVGAAGSVQDNGNFYFHSVHRGGSGEAARAGGLDDVGLKCFHDHGFVAVRGGVNGTLVNAALGRINRAVGMPGGLVPGGVEGSCKVGGDIATARELLDLALEPSGSMAWTLVESLVGRGMAVEPVGCQVALRFPEDDPGGARRRVLASSGLPGSEWHTDGMRQGKRNPFTLLLGVALSDVPGPLCGNFAVFPGSHVRLHQKMRSGGRLVGVDAEETEDTGETGVGKEVSTEKRQWSVAVGGGDHQDPWCRNVAGGSGLPDMGTPLQLEVQPGDVVLAHPMLAHRGGPNLSPHIRYMVYFRIKHVAHGTETMQAALCRSLWADLGGISGMARSRLAGEEASGGTSGETSGATSEEGSSSSSNCGGGQQQQTPIHTVRSGGSGGQVRPQRLCRGLVQPFLTEDQVATFRRDGVLVVPNILSEEEVALARAGFKATLLQHGVDTEALLGSGAGSAGTVGGGNRGESGVGRVGGGGGGGGQIAAESSAASRRAMGALSSTGGAGGVVDLFYSPWKLEATLGNARYTAAMAQLYGATFGRYGRKGGKGEKGEKGEAGDDEGPQGAQGGVEKDNTVRDDGNRNRDDGGGRGLGGCGGDKDGEGSEGGEIGQIGGVDYGDGGDDGDDGELWAHPYGTTFDGTDAYVHIDRVGYRLPDAVSVLGAADGAENHQAASSAVVAATSSSAAAPVAAARGGGGASGRRRRKQTLQRSLTPHLDCCPTAMHTGGGKGFPRWRPIQCMLSLCDTPDKNCGGFECVAGFHREFAQYFRGRGDMRKRMTVEEEDEAATETTEAARWQREVAQGGALKPPVCVGDFCPIRPREDKQVIGRFQHVPVAAGSAVFWDQRIPHANAYRNGSGEARSVVYGGYLPRVPVNAVFAREQRRRFERRLPQSDFWIERKDGVSFEEAAERVGGAARAVGVAGDVEEGGDVVGRKREQEAVVGVGKVDGVCVDTSTLVSGPVDPLARHLLGYDDDEEEE